MNYPEIKVPESVMKSSIVGHFKSGKSEFYYNKVYYTIQSKPMNWIHYNNDVSNVGSAILTNSSVTYNDNNTQDFTLSYRVYSGNCAYTLIVKGKDKSRSKLLELFDKLRRLEI